MRRTIQTEIHGPPWHDRPEIPAPRHPQRRAWPRVPRRAVVAVAVVVGLVAAGRQAGAWRVRVAKLQAERAAAAATVRPVEAILQDIETAEQRSDIEAIERLCVALVTEHADDPILEPAYLRLVQARLKLGDGRGAQKALHELRRARPQSPLLPEAMLDLAAWQYRERAFSDAASSYTDLVALVTSGDGRAPLGEDTTPEPIIWRSKTLWNEHKRAERSRTELERLARFNQALCYEQGSDGESAMRAYERFLARFPQDAFVPEARFRMARLLEAENRTDEALQAYQEVHDDALAPAAFRCESVYRTGRLHQAARRFDEAIAAYRRALPLRPAENEFRLAALGELAALLETRDRAQALDVYRELSAASTPTAVRASALQRLTALGASPVTTTPAP